MPLVAAAGLAVAAASVAAAPARDDALRFLEQRAKSDPDDFIALNQLGARYLQKLRETGDYAYVSDARCTAEASLRASPAETNIAGLALLAHVQLAAHRFGDAAESGRRLVALAPNKPFAHAAAGDALLEFGETAAAKSAYEKMRALDPESTDTHSRLAHFAATTGDVTAARGHLIAALAAAKQLVPDSPLTIAWCEVQIGELAFGTGDWDDAEQHYQAAIAALPDYFAAIDHLAELRAARQDFDGALSLYQPLTVRLPRADLLETVGDVLAFAGKQDDAKPWHDRAVAGYRQSLGKGEVQLLHHLATFFSDVREEPAEAIKFARDDLKLRHSSAAHETLAWALYRGGEFSEAAAEIEQAFAAGGRNAHILYHAGMIFSSAGDLVRGQKFIHEALTLNPRYNTFHVHR